MNSRFPPHDPWRAYDGDDRIDHLVNADAGMIADPTPGPDFPPCPQNGYFTRADVLAYDYAERRWVVVDHAGDQDELFEVLDSLIRQRGIQTTGYYIRFHVQP